MIADSGRTRYACLAAKQEELGASHSYVRGVHRPRSTQSFSESARSENSIVLPTAGSTNLTVGSSLSALPPLMELSGFSDCRGAWYGSETGTISDSGLVHAFIAAV